ncbi:YdiU family protein [Verrucomicrobiaceae bacterium N1E253]|uniref:Protein nucleotidyltransferase YdiU n=1 Tax=Oceaniferula marina TaxID=2748318 RepID=A0A851GEC9_9BACT|nr:YdiU family protein [Oceaniferula marina]NWK55903.1 YdiU family protein [Oceaniferula marina]
MPSIPFDNTYAQLPERFYVKQAAAQVPSPDLIQINRALAEELFIDPDWLQSPAGIGMLSGNDMPEGADPLAQAYAGHQFGGFVPELGDGRALLLGEVVARHGGRRDIQLKGSGLTPFSRGGDGKAALGPVLREYLLSEAMHALGVPTTRALAAVTTGEPVFRQDGPLAGAIFTRVAASHIRVGTFQYFAAQRDTAAVRELADYAIARHYPECLGTSGQPVAAAPYLAFFRAVIESQAQLVAHWMALGFIHGVMNTDNTSISGETIDYGPCAFMDAFHPDCVFSSIDVQGRYAWGNQPNIAYWNLTRLAETLLPLFDPDQDKAVAMAKLELDTFSDRFSDLYFRRFREKFGLADDAPDSLIQDALSLMANQSVDYTLFFRRLTQCASGESGGLLSDLFDDPEPFDEWFSVWSAHALPHGAVDRMRSANPVLIPRNHRVEQAIAAAYAGDFSVFHRLLGVLAHPYDDQAENEPYERPPTPDEVVHATFCGT